MSALEAVDLDGSEIEELAELLADEAPDVAAVMHAVRVFLEETGDHLEEMRGETVDMRRPHLAVLLAVVDAARARLAEILQAVDLDYRLPDADVIVPAHEGLETAGEALTEVVEALRTRPSDQA